MMPALLRFVLCAPLVFTALGCSYLKGADLAVDGWQDLGATPGAANVYRPQGLTRIEDRFIFSNHWQDTKSGVYVYDGEFKGLLHETEMPKEASHTSGFAHDGSNLWAVDYNSNRLYRIDAVALAQRGELNVLESFPTGLEGTSAATYIGHQTGGYLAISEFRRTGRTYLVEVEKVAELQKKHIREVAMLSYPNGTYSQGLTYDGVYLLEAINNLGTDRIRVMLIDEALRNKDEGRIKYCGSFAAPGSAVEDLANDGKSLWVSDESSFRFYRLDGYRRFAKTLCARD